MTVEFWAGIGNSSTSTSRNAGTGDYSTPANWTPNQVPAPDDLAIDQGGNMVATNVGIVGTTVWLDDNQYIPVGLTLAGSSLGPTSLLLCNASDVGDTVVLQNSALQGTVFVGSGHTQVDVNQGAAAVNSGWIGVANNGGSTSLLMDDYGSFGNSGGIEAGVNGSVAIYFGAFNNSLWNTGYMTADSGGSLTLHSEGQTTSNTAFTGTLLNLGQVNANGGRVELDANVVQSPTGTIAVTNNGSLVLDGATDGGTVAISSGMISFTGPSFGPAPYGAWNFDSTLAFTGDSATLDFGSNISAEFLANTNQLEVFLPFRGGPVEDRIQLSGTYSAANFSTSGHDVIYTAHPTS